MPGCGECGPHYSQSIPLTAAFFENAWGLPSEEVLKLIIFLIAIHHLETFSTQKHRGGDVVFKNYHTSPYRLHQILFDFFPQTPLAQRPFLYPDVRTQPGPPNIDLVSEVEPQATPLLQHW